MSNYPQCQIVPSPWRCPVSTNHMLGQPKTACFQKYLRNVRRSSSMRWYLLVIDGTELVCGDTVWCLVVLGGTGSVYARKPSCLYIESKSGDLVKRIRSLTHSLTDFESSWVVRLELSQRRKVKSIYKKMEKQSRSRVEERSGNPPDLLSYDAVNCGDHSTKTHLSRLTS